MLRVIFLLMNRLSKTHSASFVYMTCVCVCVCCVCCVCVCVCVYMYVLLPGNLSFSNLFMFISTGVKCPASPLSLF